MTKALKEGRLSTSAMRQLCDKYDLEKPTAPEEPLFHTLEELENAPDVEFVINNFLQAAGITGLFGLSGHGKTFIAVHMVRCLLTQEPLFDTFAVLQPAKKVIYLVPEVSKGQAKKRFLTLFKLNQYVGDRKLLIHTLAIRKPKLNDLRLLRECDGADVFLDTLPRFMEKEENAVNQDIVDALFNLLGHGARTVTLLHHSPKAFLREREMRLETIARGSGDLGAMISTGWGVRQTRRDKDTNLVYVQNVKPRDFIPPDQFLLRLAPDIDNRQSIGMAKAPGTCGFMAEEIDAGAGTVDKWAVAREILADQPTIGRDKLNKAIKNRCGSSVDNNQLADWLREQKEQEPEAELFGGTEL